MRRLLIFVAASGALAQSPPGDRVIESDITVVSVSYLGSGGVIAGYGGGRLRVWDADSGALQHRRDPERGEAPARFLPDSHQLATRAEAGVLELRDWNSAKPSRRIEGVPPHARDLAVSPDGEMVATAHIARRKSSENTVHVWDSSGKGLFSVPAGLGGVSILGFSADGNVLVAGSFDADIRIWNARNGELLRLIDELPVSMFAMSFSPDGKYLATAGVDRTVYLWDARTWKLARKIAGQPEMISALAFSPDSRKLVTGGFSDVTNRDPVNVVIWDVASGRMLRTIQAPHMVRSASFSPDGTSVAVAYGDKAISIWRVP